MGLGLRTASIPARMRIHNLGPAWLLDFRAKPKLMATDSRSRLRLREVGRLAEICPLCYWLILRLSWE